MSHRSATNALRKRVAIASKKAEKIEAEKDAKYDELRVIHSTDEITKMALEEYHDDFGDDCYEDAHYAVNNTCTLLACSRILLGKLTFLFCRTR
jgi:hypothetical protein